MYGVNFPAKYLNQAGAQVLVYTDEGESDYNIVDVAGQCLWKSYESLETYVKSGREFPCLTSILRLSSESHGGFLFSIYIA